MIAQASSPSAQKSRAASGEVLYSEVSRFV
jgi:hypothetical protein